MDPLLAYFPKDDGAYCKACVLFGNVHVSSDSNSFKLHCLVTNPLPSAASKFKDYDTQSEVHKTAVLKSSKFLNTTTVMYFSS